MKKLLICISFALVLSSVHAQNGIGLINDYSLVSRNSWRNDATWGSPWGDYGFRNNYNYNQMNYPRYLYNYNGFSYNNDGVNLTINTPWGGGNLSFPVSTLRSNDTYVYTTPKQIRDNYISINDITVGDIDYSDPNLAMNRVGASTTTPSTTQTTTTTGVYTRTLRWVKKIVSVTATVYLRTDPAGQVFYKTEIIENEQWVLE